MGDPYRRTPTVHDDGWVGKKKDASIASTSRLFLRGLCVSINYFLPGRFYHIQDNVHIFASLFFPPLLLRPKQRRLSLLHARFMKLLLF